MDMTRGIPPALGECATKLAALMTFFTDSEWSRRQGQPDICDFVAGNPHEMPIPEMAPILQRWTEPREQEWFAYKPSMVTDEARVAVASSLRERTAIAFDHEDVFLTTGAFGALTCALRSLVHPGDEVVFVSPPWFFYESMITLAGGVAVRVTSPPPSFPLDLQALRRAITPKTVAVIVNSPNNPTGRIYTPEELSGLGRLLAEASQGRPSPIVLLSDEAYNRIVFDEREFHSPANHYDQTMVIYTYGKTLLAPGARMGYLALPPSFEGRETMRNVFLLSQILGGWQFPDNVLRYALPELEALSVDVGALQRRRDRLCGALREMGYDLHTPEATFYLLPRCPIEDDWAFTEMLGADGVFVLPGAVFELPGYFRISITANDDMVERALPVFEKAIASAR